MTTRRVALALPLVLLGWIVVLALVMRLGASAPAALVVLPPAGLVGRLPAGVAVADANALGLTLRAQAPGPAGNLTPALYAAGAWLVLPAGLAGCLGLDA